jgi:hypothetical protein
MDQQPETPFESIESAQEYLCLLAEEVAVALDDVQADRESASGSNSARQLDALCLVLYNLHKLQQHIHASRRILNDLRTLRRLFAGERSRAVPVPRIVGGANEETEPLGV